MFVIRNAQGRFFNSELSFTKRIEEATEFDSYAQASRHLYPSLIVTEKPWKNQHPPRGNYYD